MGRTIEGGRLMVHGVPQGPSGDEGPAIRGALLVELGDAAPEREAARLRELARGSRLLLVDAATDADLDRLAAVAGEVGSGALFAGSAGLASALARRQGASRPPVGAPTRPSGPSIDVAPQHAASDPIVVAVSSRHPIAASQIAELGGDVVVITAPEEDVIVDGRLAHRGAAGHVAADVEHHLAASGVGALVLVGGDGALAVLARLGAQGVRIERAVVEGVPAGTVRGGVLDGVTVVTKAGGFGHPGTLRDVVEQLAASDHPEKKRTE
jgi:uncharacterized protein YgbK (DUF1537 family)